MMHYIPQCLVHMCTLSAYTESARPALLHHLQLPSGWNCDIWELLYHPITSAQLRGAKVLKRRQALNTPCLPLILQVANSTLRLSVRC